MSETLRRRAVGERVRGLLCTEQPWGGLERKQPRRTYNYSRGTEVESQVSPTWNPPLDGEIGAENKGDGPALSTWRAGVPFSVSSSPHVLTQA